MAELSFPWPDGIIGDGREYTSAEWDQYFEMVYQQMDAANTAVLYGVWNELAVTAPGANSISVNTGAAFGKGHVYWNTAALAFAPASAPGGQTRDDAVVVETDWAGGGVTGQYTTRIVLKAGAMGAPPAMTQVDGTLWQNRLYNFTIDDAGAITAVTDFRAYCKFATMVETAMLEDLCVTTGKIAADAVTPAKIPDRTRAFLVEAVNCYNDSTSLDLPRISARGWPMPNSVVSHVVGDFRMPSDFVSGLTIKPIGDPGATGNIYVESYVCYAALGETPLMHADTVAFAAVAVVANVSLSVHTVTPTVPAAGDYFGLRFKRDAVDVLDTSEQEFRFWGWLVEYTADS